MGPSIIAKVSGGRVALGAVPQGSLSPTTKSRMQKCSFGSGLHDERSSSFSPPLPLASLNLTTHQMSKD